MLFHNDVCGAKVLVPLPYLSWATVPIHLDLRLVEEGECGLRLGTSGCQEAVELWGQVPAPVRRGAPPKSWLAQVLARVVHSGLGFIL